MTPVTRAATLTLVLAFPSAGAAQGAVRQRFPRPTWGWALAQLVPSPEALITRDEVYFGLRWQVTPVLLSFALRRGVNPWRALVADPVARYGGSVELLVAPEFFALPGDPAQQWMLRTGLRAHVPLLPGGESLAMFAGASHTYFRGEHGVGFEAGLCALFGLVGAQVTYMPWFAGADAWVITLRLRYL